MFGLDDQLAELGGGGGLVVALLVALLLGLRHATDPDHLTARVDARAVRRRARRAARRPARPGLGRRARD